MRKLLFSIFLLSFCVATNVKGQQRPYYTQYILNNYVANPAVAGIENYTDIKISHRRQWVGLQGAPVTTYVTIHGPLEKSDYERETATSFHPKGENPRGQAYWENYQAPMAHSGIGLTLLNDVTGPINRFAAYGTYAYHLPLSAKTNLSFGISAGFAQMSLNTSKLNYGSSVGSDPAIASSGNINVLKPDVSAGLWLYSKDYFIGASMQQIIPQQIAFSTGSTPTAETGRLVPHTFLTAGYRFSLNEDVTFLPSTMLRYVNGLPLGIDANVKFQYQDFFWAGGSFRLDDGFAGMLGINLSNTINIGYSYDVTTSGLNKVSNGTHEIVIGFLVGNKYGDLCPRRLW